MLFYPYKHDFYHLVFFFLVLLFLLFRFLCTLYIIYYIFCWMLLLRTVNLYVLYVIHSSSSSSSSMYLSKTRLYTIYIYTEKLIHFVQHDELEAFIIFIYPYTVIIMMLCLIGAKNEIKIKKASSKNPRQHPLGTI